ncbi:aldehyde dehydrogenase family protein [Nocardia cyriacigeorgica]|uniref:aldehyde dehydrogenase family protein n=1 Tax=Nocardia cyriacigeorgica TaxID=135487 RepID=UPI0038990CBC
MSMTTIGSGIGIPSYGSYVDGRDLPGARWTYVPTARSVLDDSFSVLTRKRKLDSGELEAGAATGDVFAGRVAIAEPQVIDDALRSAARAAAQWRTVALDVRVDRLLERLRAHVGDNTARIEELMTCEGHPLELARWEISGWLEACSPVSGAYYRSQLFTEFEREGRRHIVRRMPDGVVCVNPPANAPMSSAVFGAALSIVAGNAAVVRAPRSGPLGTMWAVREVIGKALDEVGAPPGTINAICADPEPVLDAWLASSDVDDVMYFGSVDNGLAFERRCVEAGKKPILELAGNDTVIVWSDADVDHASDALLEGFFGSGQLCMIPNRVFVHPAVAEELIGLVAKKAQAMRPGYPDAEGVLLSPVLRHDRFHRYLTDALDRGAQLVTGGEGMHLDGTPGSSGYFLQPTVIRVDGLDRAAEMDAVQHETFFPLLPIVVPDADSDDHLLRAFIDVVNNNRYGLRNSLWARSDAVIDSYLANVVNGGLLKINDSHIAFSAPLPSHGGTGFTGGAFGEANYPALRTTHLQGVSVVTANTPPRYR